MRRSTLLMCFLAGLWTACGCTSPAKMWQAMKPGDYADPTDSPGDPWIEQAGTEARGDRPRESHGEPEWFHDALTSPKARSIEQNVGIH
jgi:hypothetical protein